MWNVLIVDDDFVNRKLLTEILRDKAVCDTAANGAEAIQAYNLSIDEARPYDIILLDIAMPDIDGMEVLAKVRESEESAGIELGKGIPIIMVTAYKEPLFDSFSQGCDDYIVKPIDPAELVSKMAGVLGKHKVRYS
ncbi:MAG: response regulator [Nitrospinota bacterium]|nr:response regulator [Nitrospinota bacterium]